MKISVPGSKSITNRVLLIASLARGKTIIKNALVSEDTQVMAAALKTLGAKPVSKNRKDSTADFYIEGTAGTLRAPKSKLFCGNAGTAMRFLTAILSTQKFTSTLDGNSRMRARPLKDLEDALRSLGVTVKSKKGFPPIRVHGPFTNVTCLVRGDVSSQFLSGLLIASPLTNTNITIKIKGPLTSKPYIDMTIECMKKFGVKVQRSGNKSAYRKFSISKGQSYKAVKEFYIEPDASSASYFAGVSLLTGEPIHISGISKKSFQADFIFEQIAKRMLPKSTKKNLSRTLLPIGKLDCSDFPDSAMTLAVLCAFAKGKSILTGLANLRVKECDRLHALTKELTRIGCHVTEHKNGLTIVGDPKKLHGAKIHTYDDHRMAMCFGMAQMAIPALTIQNPECVKKTYPSFWKDMQKVRDALESKNIVLIGMRGSGKSKIGKLLAEVLHRPFVDMDEEIIRHEKRTIPEIIVKKGWSRFRDIESKVAKQLSQKRGIVISTGGGVVLRDENMNHLRHTGVVIYLNCPVAILKKRIAHSHSRPSLSGNAGFIEELQDIYDKRQSRYEKFADHIVDVSRQTSDTHSDVKLKVDQIITILNHRGIGHVTHNLAL